MPAFGNSIAPEDLAQITAFLQSRKHPVPAGDGSSSIKGALRGGHSLVDRELTGIGGSGYSYTEARWALISWSSATELALLRQRQIANATNKRSRTTKIAT